MGENVVASYDSSFFSFFSSSSVADSHGLANDFYLLIRCVFYVVVVIVRYLLEFLKRFVDMLPFLKSDIRGYDALLASGIG